MAINSGSGPSSATARNVLGQIEVRLRGLKQRVRNTGLNDLVERSRNQFNYNDVFLVSFPKSGNTWSRFLLSGMVLWFEHKGAVEPNYYNIHRCVPDLHLTRVGADTNPSGLPRLLKSHREYTPLFSRVILVVRDVRDAMISRFHFLNRRRVVFDSFDSFLRNPDFGVDAWVRHTASWCASEAAEQNRLLLVRYESLQSQTKEELQRIAQFLNLHLSDEALEWVIQMGDKSRARRLEETLGRPRPAPVPFMRKGTSGQWHEEMTPEQQDFVMERAAETLLQSGYSLESNDGEA